MNLLRTLVLASSLIALPVLATTQVKGVKFEDTYQIGAQSLQLNGAGLRVKVIIDVYAAALYVAKPEAEAAKLIAQSGPKSVQIVLLRDLTGEDFAEAMIKGFKANNSPADVARFQGRLDEIKKLMMTFGKAKAGTAVRIDFVPGTGTHVLMNGKVVGPEIAGEDFYQALLRIWLGNKPVDGDLKQALLGAK